MLRSGSSLLSHHLIKPCLLGQTLNLDLSLLQSGPPLGKHAFLPAWGYTADLCWSSQGSSHIQMSSFWLFYESLIFCTERLRYLSEGSIRKDTLKSNISAASPHYLQNVINIQYTAYFHATLTNEICACIILLHAFMQLLKNILMWLLRTCLQEFHYNPRGSDTCLPCDCYPVGSFSRSCDPETGQCQCRPGVIGRQCNTCDNPFAEVTNSGCEGERAFHDSNHRFTILIWLPLKEKVCSLVVSCPLCSHLWWLPKDHHSGDLVATDKVQPACSRILPQRLCRCVPALAGTAVIETLHIWTESRRFAMFFPLCRCSHQALWCRTRMAGAWTLQLHLASVCGAQCCCMWRLLIYLTHSRKQNI